eukprot:TRINITY_DN12105_c0_g1_i2.p1 TRINITY_DN12105_c0_g1~~TRINITY_DN12105_c0_g1_i2.p1  ORF type:complete len:284 (+),score=33.73 TRINITY_DN12105_c0_g1_i2:29-880(+)
MHDSKGAETLSLPRLGRVPEPRTLAVRRRANAATGARHSNEWGQRRKLLLDEGSAPTVISRPHAGGCWAAVGALLRWHGDLAAERSCPTVLNDSHECLEMRSAYPDFTAVGARGLQQRAVNRVAMEVAIDPASERHLLQVGVGRIDEGNFTFKDGILDKKSPLLASVVWTNAGDIVSSAGPLSIVAPGDIWPGLRLRMDDFCSGAPQWLAGDKTTALLLMEIDLQRGRMSLSIDRWAADPAVISIPGLLEQDPQGRQWRPFVSLTAEGQQAKIIDLHTRFEMT